MKRLPIGKQHLEIFKRQNLLYVDKTSLVYELVEESNYYFFARPRRFGKSLLVDTLKQIFLGQQHLFEGLWIYDKIEWKTYPVIHLDFSVISYNELGLVTAILKELKAVAQSYQITLEETTVQGSFRELVDKLADIGPVVLLIDEYDKPITDYITDLPKANVNREILRTFYSNLKYLGNKFRIIFITGIAKFSKVSLFSVVNNLDDISMQRTYSTLTGITEKELLHYFGDRIEKFAQERGFSIEAVLAKIKQMYDGYSWDGKNFVYNPFSLLKFFKEGILEGYWFETGTPTFLVKLLRQHWKIGNVVVKKGLSGDFFNSFDIRYGIDPHPLLFQTGYTTVKKIEIDKNWKPQYDLDFPNIEVREAFLKNLIEAFTFKTPTTVSSALAGLLRAFQQKNKKEIKAQFNVLFADLSYLFYPTEKKDANETRQEQEFKAWEGWFHTVVHLVLQFIGIQIRCEITKHQGRIDAVIETSNYLYISEFKLEDTEKGLEQIKNKKYALSYYNSPKEVILMSIAFNQKKRELKAIQWEIWER